MKYFQIVSDKPPFALADTLFDQGFLERLVDTKPAFGQIRRNSTLPDALAQNLMA